MDPSNGKKRRPAAPDWRECQVLRHAMTRLKAPPLEWQAPNGPMWLLARHVIHLECLRCGVHRAMAIDANGGRLASKYDGYPDGYLAEPGAGRPDYDNLRLWLAGRRK